MLYCNMNLGTSAAAGHKVKPAIDPGDYLIFNVATNSQVRSYTPNDVVFVSQTREYPGPFGTWTLEPAKEDAFTLLNVGLQMHAFVDDDNNVITGDEEDATSFAIQPAGGNQFVIKLPNEDMVWTVDDGALRSPVHLEPASGSDTQRWTMQKLADIPSGGKGHKGRKGRKAA
ncbi:hypothetical protein C8R44DRAFT_787248 [Mycena epipterygia]|nr:hypothetical protein C8R44DRAFT_787248 [Mycena epipterygia]